MELDIPESLREHSRRVEFSRLAELAFLSAAPLLQRDCWNGCVEGRLHTGYGDSGYIECPACHGTTKVGITVLELAEACQGGLIAVMIMALRTVVDKVYAETSTGSLDVYDPAGEMVEGCIWCGDGVPAPEDRGNEREHCDECPLSLIEPLLQKLQPKEAP